MRPLRAGFVAGMLASMLMVAIMLFFRIFAGVPSLLELSAVRTISLIPLNVFSTILNMFGSFAKILLYVELAVLQILIGGLLGIGYAYVTERISVEEAETERRWLIPRRYRNAAWRSGFTLSIFLWIFTVILILPALDVSPFGVGLRSGPLLASGSLLIAFLAYGLSLSTFYRNLTKPQVAEAQPVSMDRRQLVIKLGLGALLLVLGGVAIKLLSDVLLSTGARSRREATRPTSEITPTPEFYIVSKNFLDPTINEREWKLEVSGLVDRPFQIAYEELKSLPYVEQFVTLECISNEVGGDLIGNAHWRGVTLRSLLERAGVKAGTVDVALFAGDDYSDSIPLTRAMDEATIVAYEMNNEALLPQHGFPARLVVPGIYGMKNVKWLSGIKPVDSDYQGFWQKQGWSDIAEIRTMSRIDLPANGSTVNLSHKGISGIAFAGDRGISRVEVSTDGGKTWEEAVLSTALSPYTWVLWTKEWQPMRVDRYNLLVRATDGKGQPQIQARAEPLPDGATGYHSVIIRVGDS